MSISNILIIWLIRKESISSFSIKQPGLISFVKILKMSLSGQNAMVQM